ncbi:hypothetical protein SCHPADRAFT_903620 [Schizopora paradoxa]|uniref:Uncharacterized protein n=1 Tax=Schizopora paradoxa TaxID=27342 RepID=A0A0H2RQE1_9AGAM|nr:hypothetical protein SCHPADRAFT_903620 [Schizopora paradoxa]
MRQHRGPPGNRRVTGPPSPPGIELENQCENLVRYKEESSTTFVGFDVVLASLKLTSDLLLNLA